MANPLERVEELFGGAVGNFSGPGGTGGFSPSQEQIQQFQQQGGPGGSQFGPPEQLNQGK